MWWSKKKIEVQSIPAANPKPVMCHVETSSREEMTFFATTVTRDRGALILSENGSPIAIFAEGSWNRFWLVIPKIEKPIQPEETVMQPKEASSDE